MFDRLRFGFFFTVAVSFFSLSSAQTPPDRFHCVWTNGPVVIDGNGSDEAWQRAYPIDRFWIPTTDQSASTKTRVRLLWDREYLYFFAEMEDHDLFADVLEHDGKTWDNDVFEMFFRPSRNHEGYYEFQVNAAGTNVDMFLPSSGTGGYSKYRSSNRFHWETAVVRNGTLEDRSDHDTGWSAEGRIPWIDLMPTGGRPELREEWLVAFCRYDFTKGRSPELSSSARLTKPSFHHTPDYSLLQFLGPAESDPNLRRVSEKQSRIQSRVTGSPEPPPPYRAVRAYPNLNIKWPIDVQVEPGTDRLIIIEEEGAYGPTKVMRTGRDGDPSKLEELLDPHSVAYSIAFHPRFAENGWMFVGSNGPFDDGPHKSRITRYTIERVPPFKVISDPVTIIDWESRGHNGAAITFGADGMLYITSGDGTSDSDTDNVGQDLSKLLSKVLRINVDQPSSGRAYSVPEDNPFVGVEGVRPETFAYGLRNPWRMTTDPKTGRIWIGNNGQDMWEQIYLLQKSANYGWSVFEGSHPFYTNRRMGPNPLTLPVAEHPHSEARSLTGGVVYHGSNFPELKGAYVYGDYSTGKVWGLKHDGNQITWHQEIADTPFQISSITLDPSGELLLVDHRGEQKGALYHLEANPDRDRTIDFPRRLSETGLFDEVSSHRVAKGLIPYSVNAPLWSDGSEKMRWIALPKDGSIDMTEQWSWNFPEDTVLMKSFAFEAKKGEIPTKQWVETRLFHKKEGEWVGYSYAWREDQSDADLVEAGGDDKSIQVLRDGEWVNLDWHYPSRTECMVCHTRAARFVLGLSTLQLNKSHDYGDGQILNQLEVLESLGVLRCDWDSDQKKKLSRQTKDAGQDLKWTAEELAAIRVAPDQLPVRSRQMLSFSPVNYPRLVDPYDRKGEVDDRVRAYLHSNCAYCHVESGGGNAQIDLAYWTTKDRMRLIDVPPIHSHFDIEGARLIAPGSEERSILLQRLSRRGRGQMPQLGTSVIDREAVELVREWIHSLK